MGWKLVATLSGLSIFVLLAKVFTLRDYQPPLGAGGAQALATAQQTQGTVGLIGIPMYQDFTVPLQATAMLLLIAVVGAVVLAKRKV
jgi:NADH-quinone oxidoreductase subunit J